VWLLVNSQIKGRTIRVDHVSNYKPPKDTEDIDDITKNLRDEGCAPKLPDQLSSEEESEEEEEEEEEQYAVAVKKSKKGKGHPLTSRPAWRRVFVAC
jgi:RNA-binding motif X-linked protein 2